jgi:hypothetical protein
MGAGCSAQAEKIQQAAGVNVQTSFVSQALGKR